MFHCFFRCQGQEHRWARSRFRPFTDLIIQSAMVQKGIITLSKLKYLYSLFSNNKYIALSIIKKLYLNLQYPKSQFRIKGKFQGNDFKFILQNKRKIILISSRLSQYRSNVICIFGYNYLIILTLSNMDKANFFLCI